MPFTLDQKKIAYKKLPEEVQDFIMSNETSEIIYNSSQKLGLTTEQIDEIDSEIQYAMVGLQSLDQAIENISSLTSKTKIDFDGLKKNIDKEIFDVIKNLKGENVLDVADIPENLPMIEEGETVHDVPHVETPAQSIPIKVVAEPEPTPVVTSPSVPEPQAQTPQAEVEPVATSVAEAKPTIPKPLSNVQYPGGKDPYREPLA